MKKLTALVIALLMVCSVLTSCSVLTDALERSSSRNKDSEKTDDVAVEEPAENTKAPTHDGPESTAGPSGKYTCYYMGTYFGSYEFKDGKCICTSSDGTEYSPWSYTQEGNTIKFYTFSMEYDPVNDTLTKVLGESTVLVYTKDASGGSSGSSGTGTATGTPYGKYTCYHDGTYFGSYEFKDGKCICTSSDGTEYSPWSYTMNGNTVQFYTFSLEYDPVNDTLTEVLSSGTVLVYTK